MSKWLTWEPSRPQVMANLPGTEPAKPTKPTFAGFAGAPSGENPIIRGPEPTPAGEPRERVKHLAPSDKAPGGCPYSLPPGISLLRYEPKASPVAVTVCSVVADPDKFIRHALAELDARLRDPVQIKAGDSVFDLLNKLADCGLELRLEWPPERIIESFQDSELAEPIKLAETAKLNLHLEITDEDVPF